MSVYLSIYLVFYTLNLLALQLLLMRTFGSKLKKISISNMWLYIVEYSKFKSLYFALIIALTGLPPFILFFVKFNYLIESYGRLGFFFFYVVFLTVFTNMIYYAQPILFKNVKLDFDVTTIKGSKVTYNELFFIVMLLGFFFLSVFFFPDLCIISSLNN